MVTCSQAQDKMRRDEKGAMIKQASNILLEGHSFDPFEFQSILRGSDVSIPADLIVSIFSAAEKSNGGNSELNLQQIGEFIVGLNSSREIHIKALKATASDMTCVFYLLAGSFLLFGLPLFALGEYTSVSSIGWL